jgi:hypothetical protein
MQSGRPKHRRKKAGVKQPSVDFSSRRCVDIELGILLRDDSAGPSLIETPGAVGCTHVDLGASRP